MELCCATAAPDEPHPATTIAATIALALRSINANLEVGDLKRIQHCASLHDRRRRPGSVVALLNATQSLWALVFASLVIGRGEMIGRRTVLAALLVVGAPSSVRCADSRTLP